MPAALRVPLLPPATALLAALLAALLLAAPRPAVGEEEEPLQAIPDTGFLQVLNLVGLATPTYLEIDGQGFNRGEPVPAGGSSGVLALRPADYSLTVRNEGARPPRATVPLSVENGRNLVIILFESVSTGSDGGETVRLQHVRLAETLESELPRLSVVSLLDDPVARASLGPHRLELRPQQAERVEVEVGDFLYLRLGNATVGEIAVEKQVHYLGFLFNDPETGQPALSLIENEKLEYQPPLEDDDDG